LNVFVEQYTPRRLFVSICEVFGIALNYLFYNNFDIFLASKSLIVNIFLNLFVDNVIFENKIGFHEFFKRFLESYVVNLCECIEPLKASKEILKSSLPVSSILELVLDFLRCLSTDPSVAASCLIFALVLI
jgi:hypothetical protein